MKRLLLASLFALAALPTLAGEGLMCSGPDGLEVHVPLGAGPGMFVLAAEIGANGKRWSTDANAAGATPIVAEQAAAVDDRVYFDFSDFRGETTLIRIRLFRAGIEDEGAIAGLIDISGERAWPISCDFG